MKSQSFRAIRALSPRRVYFGWWVSIVGACNTVFSAGPTFQAASVLFKALEDEFGWSRTLISGVATVGRLGSTLLGPLEGWLIDKFGAGRMVLVGFTVGGGGLIFFSQVTGPLQFYAAFLVMSVGLSSGGFTPSLTATNAWMNRRRGLGMSIVEGGVSVGGLLVPLIVWGISQYGWRTTVLAMGIITILAGPFIARVLGKQPTVDQLATQIPGPGERARRVAKESSHDFTVKEALRTRAFWSVSITHMFVNVSTGAISAHLYLHLTDDDGVGLDLFTAAGVVPIMVATSFVAQLVGGIVGDLWNKRVLVPFLVLIQGSSLVILALANSFWMAAAFAIVWGIGFGARTPMLLAMRGEFFGRRHFATIFVLSSFPMSLGMMIAPVVVGWSYDAFNTYDWSLYVLAGLCVLGSVTALFAKRPPSPAVRQRLQVRAARRSSAY